MSASTGDVVFSWLSMECVLLVFGALLLTLLVGFALLRWTIRRRRLVRFGADGSRLVTVAFFHPYCNSGGGGERVLWCAIRALQKRYPQLHCVVYTGDRDASGPDILQRAAQRFSIRLGGPVEFVFLGGRDWVEAGSWPRMTLLGQSLGSLRLGWEALWRLTPDLYVDSMGYAFTMLLFKHLGGCRTASYVHYPTISTDMLSQVADRTLTYNNAGAVARSPLLTSLKLAYYRVFAALYGWAGRRSDVVMVNSSWTLGHVTSLWGVPAQLVFPPCDVAEFTALPLRAPERGGALRLVSVAQFRPEKDHALQLAAFDLLCHRMTPDLRVRLRLVLVGGCRNRGDAERVEELRRLSQRLGIAESVEFRLNVGFDELKDELYSATMGLHTMWNEHFGIGVVECMAAGTIILAHDSGGPKMDIVVDYQGQKTGFLASDAESYAVAMETILGLGPAQSLSIRQAARHSVKRFSDQAFEEAFNNAMQPLFT